MFMEDAGGDLVQDDLLSVHIQGMTGIWTALEPCNDIICGSETVHDLSLSLISPL
jgi:hypothetical protein